VKLDYLSRAAERFLAGLPYSSPAAAVEAGERTVGEWCETLNAERAADGLPEARRKRGVTVLDYEGPDVPAPSLLAFLSDVAA
jgi:hypothetical protein